MRYQLSFFTLLLMISFASVNAVLFTPGLPEMAKYFAVSTDTAQLTITWFLVGYAFGQLVYGPIANRFGKKPALYAGVGLQILSSLLCVYAGAIHEFNLLVLGRFLLALGSGVGLKMTFTLVNESYDAKIASQKISYLMTAFAIAPGLSVALGGLLTTHFGWASCFYASAVYGLILLFLVTKLPETQLNLDRDALKISHLIKNYASSFQNRYLLIGGFLMGGATCFVYIFAATAPFIAINLLHMTSAQYGSACVLPPLGLLIGSLVAAQVAKKLELMTAVRLGVCISGLGVVLMLIMMWMKFSALISLFIPMVIIYFGICFVNANASTYAMSHVSDKTHGSAVMNFINMGLATVVVLCLGWLPMSAMILPMVYMGICLVMISVTYQAIA
jgi:DHA1 family bicyclomycin/chloramphenicol resistance-like MFS transporter